MKSSEKVEWLKKVRDSVMSEHQKMLLESLKKNTHAASLKVNYDQRRGLFVAR